MRPRPGGLSSNRQEVLQRLGISDLHKLVEDLSGGYRKRVGLASALVACPDVLLLDEPTNHLDAAAVEWLQSWLDRYPGAVVLVTHDRYVLDRVTRRIVEVADGEARSYDGNYSTYLQGKAQQDVADAAAAAKIQERAAARTGLVAPGPKGPQHQAKATTTKHRSHRSAPAKKAKAKLEMASVSRRIGKVAIEAEHLKVTSDGTTEGTLLLDDFTYSFSPEDRIGIIGPNGSGKSTLLDLIAGRRTPSGGELRLVTPCIWAISISTPMPSPAAAGWSAK